MDEKWTFNGRSMDKSAAMPWTEAGPRQITQTLVHSVPADLSILRPLKVHFFVHRPLSSKIFTCSHFKK